MVKYIEYQPRTRKFNEPIWAFKSAIEIAEDILLEFCYGMKIEFKKKAHPHKSENNKNCVIQLVDVRFGILYFQQLYFRDRKRKQFCHLSALFIIALSASVANRIAFQSPLRSTTLPRVGGRWWQGVYVKAVLYLRTYNIQ